MIDRERVRALVREELLRRGFHPALSEIVKEELCREDLDYPVRRPCLIEPDRPCYNSGYCKKLGY